MKQNSTSSTYKSGITLLFSQLCPTLWLHGLQHTRLTCPSLSSEVCSNSCPLCQWCHPTISSCFPLLSLPSIFPSIRVFSNEPALCIRWPKYWSFSVSPFNEYQGWFPLGFTGLISLLSKGLFKSLLWHHIMKKQNIKKHTKKQC